MELKIIYQTSRSVVLEINDGGIFYTKASYSLKLNEIDYGITNRVITGIYQLKPDTEYTLCAWNGKEVGRISFTTLPESYTLNVKDFGAKGDGSSDDTCCIQAAIMACPKNARVYIPEGIYRITSIFLKNNLKIEISKNAVIKAFATRENRPVMPGLIQNYDETLEYNLGTWEGNPLTMFAGIIHGISIENVEIYGQGVIDGNAGSDNWWKNPKDKDVAWRPRTIFLQNCKNIVIEGICVQNSPSWTVHPYFCQNLKFIGMSIVNPKDSPNTDALDVESCRDVEIAGVYFSVGDDCIALKSGKIYMGSKYKIPSEKILIRQCCMRDGHGSITIGSEMAGGVKNVIVNNCLFLDTDRGLRIKTRRGRGKDAVIDSIIFDGIKMNGVMTPLVVNCFYFCDPDGHSSYVQMKDYYTVDDRTPEIRQLIFRNLECKNCHVAAVYIYGLPEKKIEEVTLENTYFEFTENSKLGIPAMMDDVEPVMKMGIFINNVKKLIMKNLEVKGQIGEEIVLTNVDQQLVSSVKQSCGEMCLDSCIAQKN